jgi:DNA-binding protein YbaB
MARGQSAVEYRQLAATLRAQAAAGGGIVSYTFNGKQMRRESVKDLLAAARDCDAMADDLEAVSRGFYGSTRLIYRRG